MSESAKLGGGIGWVNQNQISKKVFLAIKDLKIGEFSDPIITAGGIILLNVNAKKNVDTEINKKEEMKRLISFEQNRILNEYSMIYYNQSLHPILLESHTWDYSHVYVDYYLQEEAKIFQS